MYCKRKQMALKLMRLHVLKFINLHMHPIVVITQRNEINYDSRTYGNHNGQINDEGSSLKLISCSNKQGI